MEGVEEEGDDEEDALSPTSCHKTTTLEISMISADGYKSRHSQPECGYALEPSQWTEYSIHTMDPDNLELTFEFFEVKPIGILPRICPCHDKLFDLCYCKKEEQTRHHDEMYPYQVCTDCMYLLTGGYG